MSTHFMGTMGGAMMHMDDNIDRDSAGKAWGAVFNRDGLILVERDKRMHTQFIPNLDTGSNIMWSFATFGYGIPWGWSLAAYVDAALPSV